MFIPLAHQVRKILKAISNQKKCKVVKYRVEPESKKSNVNDVLNWLSIVWNVTISHYSVSYNLHAPIWMALRKRGELFKFASEKEEGGGGGASPVGNYVI